MYAAYIFGSLFGLNVAEDGATKKPATNTGKEDIIPREADRSGLVKFALRRQNEHVVDKEPIRSLASGAVSLEEDHEPPRM